MRLLIQKLSDVRYVRTTPRAPIFCSHKIQKNMLTKWLVFMIVNVVFSILHFGGSKVHGLMSASWPARKPMV